MINFKYKTIISYINNVYMILILKEKLQQMFSGCLLTKI